MSLENPYDYSQADGFDTAPSGLAGVLEELRMTRPWVRLMGVLGLLGATLMFLGSIVTIVGGLAGGGQGVALLGVGFAYLLVGCLYAYPFWKLVKYGSAISQAEQTASVADIEVALSHQRSFWRFVGILTVIVIAFYLLGAVALIAFSVA